MQENILFIYVSSLFSIKLPLKSKKVVSAPKMCVDNVDQNPVSRYRLPDLHG